MTIPSDRHRHYRRSLSDDFVRAKLKLERMRPASPERSPPREEPLRNVPRAAREEGHTIWDRRRREAHIVTIRGLTIY